MAVAMKRWALALLAMAGLAQAQGSLQRGDVEVYWSAQATQALAPEMARQYAVTRSPNRALLTVVVLRAGAAVPATVSGSATDAQGQRQVLAVREVREGDSVSYLAEPRIAARDTLDFDLSVLPAGGGAAIPLKFRQEFFPER